MRDTDTRTTLIALALAVLLLVLLVGRRAAAWDPEREAAEALLAALPRAVAVEAVRPPPEEVELAAVFQRLAAEYLSDVGPQTRRVLWERYYTDEEAALYARAVYHGLRHRGVPVEDWPRHAVLITATVWQQSSGKRDALSYNNHREGEPEPVGEDVGWYQIRRRWVFGDGGVWHEVYPDVPVPQSREAETRALTDPMTAAPLWVAHLQRQRRTCGALLRTIRSPEEACRKLGGDPLRYCRATWVEKGQPILLVIGGVPVALPAPPDRRQTCTGTRRCYVVRHGFGIATLNMGASNVVRWGRRVREALEWVRSGGEA